MGRSLASAPEREWLLGRLHRTYGHFGDMVTVNVRRKDEPRAVVWDAGEQELSWTERKGASVGGGRSVRLLEVVTTVSLAEASGRVCMAILRR